MDDEHVHYGQDDGAETVMAGRPRERNGRLACPITAGPG